MPSRVFEDIATLFRDNWLSKGLSDRSVRVIDGIDYRTILSGNLKTGMRQHDAWGFFVLVHKVSGQCRNVDFTAVRS